MAKPNPFRSFNCKNKYGNQKPKYNGMTFDSKKEMERYKVLEIMEKGNLISDLKCQVKIPITPTIRDKEGNVVEFSCSYYADFAYMQNGQKVYEDVKGYKTPEYIVKRKVLLHFYGIRILET